MAQADTLQQRRGTLARFRDRGLADQQRHADVFQRGEFRQQVVELVHEPSDGCAAGHASSRQGRQLFAVQPDAALGRRVEAAQQVEQGTFARTELPTIATRSPGCNSSCRPASTCTDSGPSS
jgi:hypothetical protein